MNPKFYMPLVLIPDEHHLAQHWLNYFTAKITQRGHYWRRLLQAMIEDQAIKV